MNIENNYKILTHTQNRSKAECTCEDMNKHVLKGNDTNPLKINETWNVQAGDVNKNSNKCNIKNTDKKFMEYEITKKIEKKSMTLDLHEIDKLEYENEKGKSFYMGTKNDTSCSSYTEEYSNKNDKEEDSNVMENNGKEEIVSLRVNRAEDESANYKCNRKGKMWKNNILEGEIEILTHREVELNKHVTPNELDKGGNNISESEMVVKINYSNRYTKEYTCDESLRKIKETTTSLINSSKNVKKKKCKSSKEFCNKTNDGNLELKYECNNMAVNQITDQGNVCNEKNENTSNRKGNYEMLNDEEKEHRMDDLINNKNKRKHSDDNGKNIYDTNSCEKGNKKKKKTFSHFKDNESVKKEKTKSNHKRGKIGKVENSVQLIYEKDQKDVQSEDGSTVECCTQENVNKEEQLNDGNQIGKDDKIHNTSEDNIMAGTKKNTSMKEGISRNIDEFHGTKDTKKTSNENGEGHVKKKYVRLLKSLETNLSKKMLEQECAKRIQTWGEKFTLEQKINQFIKNKIATRTEYKYGKKQNTLSICNQFNLYNHLTMLNDFNRLHYYRAAMRWTGHKDVCEYIERDVMPHCGNSKTDFSHMSSSDNISAQNNSTILVQNSSCEFEKENIDSMNNTINAYNRENVKTSDDKNGTKNPYIFFENNKECYVYNKNIIEIGTGPLSLLSINSILNGAKHVDALEVNKDASEMAKKLIEGYNLEDFIKIINCYSKMYVYKEGEDQRRLKRKNSFYNYLDCNINEQYCSDFNYDLIISEVIGDFASQEGVADIYLDLHKKIFAYRKYQEYLYKWNMKNKYNKDVSYDSNNRSSDKCVLHDNVVKTSYDEVQTEHTYNGKNKNNEEQNIKKENKMSYNEFAADEELYNCKEFYNMNVKSIPYSISTYYCPVKFPYYDNIIYKSENYPERTIISPKSKLLQSVMLEWSNLLLSEDENDNADFGTLEYIYLEQNVANQVIQKRNHIFQIQKSGPFCGFLITIDVEIRKGEHFGTKYGTCDSWYTNIVLLKEEVNVNKNDLIISKTYTNLLNYNEHVIDRKTVLVSRPSYTFYGYILKSIRHKPFLKLESGSYSDSGHSSYKNSDDEDHTCNINKFIYLDDETILSLDQMNFHEQILADMNKQNSSKNESPIIEILKKNNNSDETLGENMLNDLDEQAVDKCEDHSKVDGILADNYCSAMGVNSSAKEESYSASVCNNSNIDIGSRMMSSEKDTDGLANESMFLQNVDKTKKYEDFSMGEKEKEEEKNLDKKKTHETDTSGKDKEPNILKDSSISKQNIKRDNLKEEKNSLAKVEKDNRGKYDNINNNNINNNNRNCQQKNIENASSKGTKNSTNKKKKKDNSQSKNKDRKLLDKSREEYENEIFDITNNYNSNSKFCYENLKDKILVYKNMLYKLMLIYEPIVIDYDEQATVIYKKDDIYNNKENNVNKFVNNVYQ
ncbi:hypothetical protein, conserved [Plasmodium gonderi]|uniref:Uncharacterized protein n=1 Tax=Plasmodium gonderi TaxID=77519 RepID=A0A1Y1JLE5_PLAGO|nr:hypothetical protein, conserved [Plasmodium gonderi]GAW81233.1 hypothetical protein, conserved [Plasmodium gonderi]